MQNWVRAQPGRIQWRALAGAALFASLVPSASALRIVVTNDDGFESHNLQALFTALLDAGHEVILSAPYNNQSGTSATPGTTSNFPPTSTRSPGGTIAAGSAGVGPTTLGANQYYVDSTPVGAVLYGIEVLAQARWRARPDLVISGPNIGHNLGHTTVYSGTVGAAVAALNVAVPAIAVSAANGDATTAPMLAAIILRLVAAATDRGTVLLPPGSGLNVNVPVLELRRSVSDYRFAFTRITTSGTPGDSYPFNESNAITEGSTVTVSPIQGTYLAPPDRAALILARMRGFFATAIPITNPKLTNLSVRGSVGTGTAVQIAGLYVSGTTSKTMLIRASGPALETFGVSGALSDPIVELYDRDNRLVATNDNWSDDPAMAETLAAASTRAGAFAWSLGSKDAALLLSLAPGAFTVVVRGAGGTTGIALIETYDVNVD